MNLVRKVGGAEPTLVLYFGRMTEQRRRDLAELQYFCETSGVVRWENLDRIWTLVRTKDAFIDYVQGSTHEFLQAN